MEEKKIDKEIEAISTISNVLQSLEDSEKQRVLEYILKRFNIRLSSIASHSPQYHITSPDQQTSSEQLLPKVTHIEQLKELKKPKTAIEMAAIVAYFLSEMVPLQEKKATVTTRDMETFFKIANYPLPTAPQQLLGNAKNAGYFDLVSTGEYKLNAIGYNLVAHNLPRGEGSKQKKIRKKPSGSKSKKSNKKKR
jgi:hypothetical protein